MSAMPKTNDQIVVCTYRVKAGCERDFIGFLTRHWPTLRKLGLVHELPRMALQGRDTDKTSCFVEVFAWKDRGFEVAHKHPEVLALWEPMEQMCEARNGLPATEFPHYTDLTL
jgi:hypothetical protein